MRRVLVGLVCGFIFGWGLLVSGMMNPAKVLNFLAVLAIPLGRWDPTLVVVMGAALAVAAIGFRLARPPSQSILARSIAFSRQMPIDRDLVVGAALFGIGWGLAGLCPGPALANLATLSPPLIVFVLAMAAGMGLHEVWKRSRASARAGTAAPGAVAADG